MLRLLERPRGFKVLIGTVFLITACQDRDSGSPIGITSPALGAAGDTAMPRSWRDASNELLWREALRTDGSFRVGLKAPGSDRGVHRGKPNLRPSEWLSMTRTLAQQQHLDVIQVDSTRLPMLVMKPASLEVMARVRALPFVDYVEPRYQRVSFNSGGSGCGGDDYLLGTTVIPYDASSGDVVGPGYDSDGMNVINAWKRTQGHFVTIGLTDTGVDTDEPSEFSPTYAASGMSTGRWVVELNGPAVCNHGMRLGSLAAAPRNGRGIVGVAYRANVAAYHQSDDVVFWDETAGQSFDPVQSINAVAYQGAQVVSIGWGMFTTSQPVSDIIDWYYYDANYPISFIGAAGTCGVGSSCPYMETAVFPASKLEVFSVSGANSDGTRPDNVYAYGTELGVLAYTNLPSMGLHTGTALKLVEGSSASTGVVTGAAALVLAKNPDMTPPELYNRLARTAGIRCGAPVSWNDQMINVSAAIGNACVLRPKGVQLYNVQESGYPMGYSVPFDALIRMSWIDGVVAGGSGSYHVEWSFDAGALGGTEYPQDQTSDDDGTYRRFRRDVTFQRANDFLPYTTTVRFKVVDDVYGTEDIRSAKVLVCDVITSCYGDSRPFPGPAITATITGPSSARAGQPCRWKGSASGGASPYLYYWYVNNVFQSIGQQFDYTPTGSFSLRLDVRDNAGVLKSASRSVAVSNTAPACVVGPT